MTDCRYEEGQVWTFRDAPLPDSRVIVGKVDNTERDGWVVSVCVGNVYMPDAATGERYLTHVSHTPMTAQALDASVIAQAGISTPLEGFDEAYRGWRDEYAKGEAGVFIISVAEIIGYFADAILKGH
jgi:hypothetical protein